MQPAHVTDFGQLYDGDCLDVLATIPDESVHVVFADPPFNLGKDYGLGVDDSLRDDDYLTWCSTWLKECVRILAPGGAMWVYNLPKWNVEIGRMLNDFGLAFRHWVALYRPSGMPIQGRLHPSHYSMLYYTAGRPRVFGRVRLPIEACRHCGGDIKDYGGHRKEIHPDGTNLTDVWTDIPALSHRAKKFRQANELPEKMLERVLTISSLEGDVVFDPFGGSGTTYVVAERMRRRWIGCELGDIAPIIDRLTPQCHLGV